MTEDSRVAPRVPVSDGCHVEMDGKSYPMKNWSATGLFFGPYEGDVVPRQKLYLRVTVKDAAFDFDFPAEAIVARVQNGMIGAYFADLNPGFKKMIYKYFSYHRELRGDEY
ncbi:hypothetical protein [Oceanibaculum pacificum]|uniref:PilZ domain-containing protein n=1 Tax=Oceanibaculum pacificum TaxID=580166 RepID=A0A154WFH0_9PROT|nr:hypothetical protein [Oceanibaculum pacificum]KZD12252.1 hypothetical protein AUP43_16990 [Oceanibaculum pacificum]